MVCCANHTVRSLEHWLSVKGDVYGSGFSSGDIRLILLCGTAAGLCTGGVPSARRIRQHHRIPVQPALPAAGRQPLERQQPHHGRRVRAGGHRAAAEDPRDQPQGAAAVQGAPAGACCVSVLHVARCLSTSMQPRSHTAAASPFCSRSDMVRSPLAAGQAADGGVEGGRADQAAGGVAHGEGESCGFHPGVLPHYPAVYVPCF